MKKILITAIGGDIAQSVALLIRKYFSNIDIIGCDFKNQKIEKKFIDKFILVPKASNTYYINKLNYFINKMSIDLVLPMNEDELNVINKNIELLNKKIIIIPNKNIIKIGVDKFKTYKELKKLGLVVPWTVVSKSSMPMEYPCIVKPRKGSGGKKVRIINNKKEASDFYEKRGYIFQELLTPSKKEFTCAVHRNKKGEVRSLILLRKLTNGYTSWAKVVESEEIKKICKYLANELGLFGSINIQLIQTKNGPKIFEINPRFSSTVLMRDKVFFQDLKWTIQEYIGAKVHYKNSLKNRILIKKSLSNIEVLKV